jgi:hypothetical protein
MRVRRTAMRANSAATKKPFRSTRNKIAKSLKVISGHDRLGSRAAVAKNIGISINTGGKKLLQGVWEISYLFIIRYYPFFRLSIKQIADK